MNIKFNDVMREDRVRQSYKETEELADSIKRFGLIQPIVIDLGKMTLVAGGSRMKALEYIFKTGINDETHDTIRQLYDSRELVLGVHYTDKPTASVAELSEMELEENIRRHALDWKEECIGISRIHALRSKRELEQGATWPQRRTAELLGVSRAKITYILLIAQELRNPESPVQKASSVTDALAIITKKKADEVAAQLAMQSVRSTDKQKPVRGAVEVLLDDSLVLPGERSNKHTPIIDFEEGDDPSDNFFADLPDVIPFTSPDDNEDDDTNRLVIDVRQTVHHLSIESALDKWGQKCCDGIITDWPYGIDMSNLEGINDVDRVLSEHDRTENIDSFERWLNIMWHLLRDDSFCVIFNDPEHHGRVWEIAKSIGFKVQRWPLVWIKTHAVKNSASSYNFTKNFEEAVVLRKGNASLQRHQATSFWMGSNSEVKKQFHNHPFVKPFELWQWIAEATVRKGGEICDPFSGVGSSTIAFLSRGYRVFAGEINEDHYHHQCANVEQFYLKATKGKVDFV